MNIRELYKKFKSVATSGAFIKITYKLFGLTMIFRPFGASSTKYKVWFELTFPSNVVYLDALFNQIQMIFPNNSKIFSDAEKNYNFIVISIHYRWG